MKRTIVFLVTELPRPSQKLVLGWPEKVKKKHHILSPCKNTMAEILNSCLPNESSKI